MSDEVVVTDSLVRWARDRMEISLMELESSVQSSPAEVDAGVASDVIAAALGELVDDLASITEGIDGLLSTMSSAVSSLSATDDDVVAAVNGVGGGLL